MQYRTCLKNIPARVARPGLCDKLDLMGKNPFESHLESSDKDLKARLEELHRMKIDTEAEMAQAKVDAVENVSRAKDLVPLKRTLDLLRHEEELVMQKLGRGSN